MNIGHDVRDKTAHRRQYRLWGRQSPWMKPADQLAEMELLPEPGNALDAVLQHTANDSVSHRVP